MAFHQDEAFITFSWIGDSDGRVAMRTNDALLNHLRLVFSVVDKKAVAIQRFSNLKHMSTRKYAISPTGRFRHGMMKSIVAEIKACVSNPVFSLDAKFREQFPKKMADALALGSPKLKLTPRNYQAQGIEQALRQGCGVLLYPTGSGKTLIMAGIAKNILDSSINSTVFIVTLTHLVEQTRTTLIDYGFDPKTVSVWTGTNEFVPARVVICGPQILVSAIKRPEKYSEPLDFLSKTEAFIVDEVHQVKKENKIVDFEKYVKTHHRFGFTGTLPEEKQDEWNVIGMFGPVISTVSREELVKNGSITDVVVCEVKMDYLEYPEYVRGGGQQAGMQNFRYEQNFLYTSDFRNKTISKIALKTKKNCLVLVDRIEHGELLVATMRALDKEKEVFFIRGEVEGEVREEIRKLMEKKDNIVCVAISSIFSTGINISNLHYIVFANTCKAKVSVIQSIGRGVRTHDGKTHVIVFDIHDNFRYGNKLFEERRKLYQSQGFKMERREIEEPLA